MTQYYFVTASLPTLEPEVEPELHLEKFLALCAENLTAEDMGMVRKIQQLVDIANLAALWRGQPLDNRGSLRAAELEGEEALASKMPAFVAEFLDKYPTTAERIHHHGWLVARFFQDAIPASSGFLHDYFTFERAWRLIMVAMRAKELGKDLGQELQWEDPRDPVVALLLAQRDAPNFEPPVGFEALREIFSGNERNPLELHRQLELFRFGRVEALVEDQIFSRDAILGYMVELMIAERLFEIVNESRAA